MKVIEIPIKNILIKERKRAISEEKVKEISDSINMLLDRKRIYEELHPETVSINIKGGHGRGHKTKAETAPVFVNLRN